MQRATLGGLFGQDQLSTAELPRDMTSIYRFFPSFFILFILSFLPWQEAVAKKGVFGLWGASSGLKARQMDGAIGSGKPELTGSQLRQCLEMEEDLQDLRSKLESKENELKDSQAELEVFNTKLRLERSLIDRGSPASVDHFNSQVDKQREMTAAVQNLVEDYNRGVEQQNRWGDKFELDCVGRPYDPSEAERLVNQ